jgi:glutathione S-transferase
MRYELYYWPEIQGRGEFVRLVDAMMRMMQGAGVAHRPYAPPFLKAGKLVIAQTALILHYLGPRLGLVPRREADRLWAHQLQLTITDFVKEIHDTHHPISSALYYEQQRAPAKQYTKAFWQHRVPKMMGYFEAVAARSGGPFVFGRRLSYVDLSLFQIVEGLRYAFPKRMKAFEKKIPLLVALSERVAGRPRIAAYLASKRRIPFNEWGIFRHYRELDR